MSNSDNQSAGFRRQLAAELNRWQSEGLVTPELADTLTQRYDLASAQAPRIGAFAAVLYALGALLVGGGVIAFVAANWSGIPDVIKVVGLLATMVLFQAVGYHWLKNGPHFLLGHALLIMGAVFFGANVGLFGQIFPTGSHWSSGFGIWAVACTLIAYGAGSVPIALLGLLASATCYFGGLEEDIVRGAFPIIIGIQSIPFGIKWRSKSTLFFGLILLAATMSVGSAMHSGGILAVCAVLICGVVFALAGFTLQLEARWRGMATVFQVCAGLCVCGALFLTSIGDFTAHALRFDEPLSYERGFAPLLTGLFGILSLIWLGPTLRSIGRAPDQAPLLGTLVGASILTMLTMLIGNEAVVWLVATVAFGAATLALIWHGLNHRDKLFYATGVLLLGSRLMLYFFLANTGLLAKAMFMVVGGVAIIVIALQYEKWSARLAAPSTGTQT